MHTLLFRPNHRSFPVCQVSVEVEYYYLLSTRSRCSNRRSIPDSFGYPKGRNLSILNESTSSFRYPCLVHVFPLCRHRAWTISSSYLAVLRTFLDATNLLSLRIVDA